MFRTFLIACLLPIQLFAQNKLPAPGAKKPVPTGAKAAAAVRVRPADGYRIRGIISGVSDDSKLQMLNGQTGALEQTAAIQKGRFNFTGKVGNPEFKLLAVDGQPPFITVFLDNSDVIITAKKDSLESAEIKGSASQNDFRDFTRVTSPYADLLNGKGRFEPAFMDEAAAVIETYIIAHKNSHFAPMATARYDQIVGDHLKLEEFYNSFPPAVQTSFFGNYLSQKIADNKKIAYGKPLDNFIQPDTAGTNISLASFKGKYVLVDFWASWCGPCRQENPNVVNTYEKYKNKNFTVLGVSLDRSKQPWLDAIAADNLTWTNVSDLKFWGNAVAVQFGIQSIPQNFLLDPEGNLIGKNLRGAALEYKLSKVLR